MDTETTYSTVEGDAKDWVLFSGGHDSLVSTHYLMQNGYTDAVLHLDTTTGIPENQDFVVETCREYEWPLRIERTEVTLRKWALELGSDDKQYGFPGAAFHPHMYHRLKERQLETIASETEGKPHYWTGVRRGESDRRMRTTTDAIDETEQWYWHAPIRNWTEERMREYLDANDIERNPVVDAIHRSGECYCGAFAQRDEELIDLEANYPEHYKWLKSLEKDVIGELGPDNPRAYWGHGNLSESDLTHLKTLREPEDMMLCRDCRVENQNPASDVDW